MNTNPTDPTDPNITAEEIDEMVYSMVTSRNFEVKKTEIRNGKLWVDAAVSGAFDTWMIRYYFEKKGRRIDGRCDRSWSI